MPSAKNFWPRCSVVPSLPGSDGTGTGSGWEDGNGVDVTDGGVGRPATMLDGG